MIEVVYQSQGEYLFGEERIPGHSYLQIKLEYSSEEELNQAMEKYKRFKDLKSDNLVHLVRILKDNLTILLGYQYFNISLKQYLEQINDQSRLNTVLENINDAIAALVPAGIKSELYFESISIDEHDRVKLFIPPSFQMATEETKLIQFYQTEKKKIELEIEDISEGRQLTVEKKEQKTRNFIINGNALVFDQESKVDNLKSNLQLPSNHTFSKITGYIEKTQPKKNLNSDSFQQTKQFDNPIKNFKKQQEMNLYKIRDYNKSSMEVEYPVSKARQQDTIQSQEKKKNNPHQQTSKYAQIQQRAKAAKQKAENALNSISKGKKN